MSAVTYVIWSNKHSAWWGPDRLGYTRWIEEAGRYDLAEARKIVAKSTLGGELSHSVRTQIFDGNVTVVDTVLVLAPEWERHLDQVDNLLDIIAAAVRGDYDGGEPR